ncbi:unnamed protein product [Candidula unifasciata]|uniref:Uncharacterized protein n=1 Tax=Candidula unifasciata TaxID=100452 RepID=A0A8S3YLF2_9EUPU|nr:unnamed protein product [Candidula unifasciata]
MASSKPSQRNYFKQKLILKEEEKVLKEMLGKFQDQLNRLKIEELALMSLLKMQEEQSKTGHKDTPVKSTVGSLDSISDTASITSVAPIGLMYENVSEMNKEFLDLNVDGKTTEGQRWQNDFEEEEDDEGGEKGNVDGNRGTVDEHFEEYMDTYWDMS